MPRKIQLTRILKNWAAFWNIVNLLHMNPNKELPTRQISHVLNTSERSMIQLWNLSQLKKISQRLCSRCSQVLCNALTFENKFCLFVASITRSRQKFSIDISLVCCQWKILDRLQCLRLFILLSFNHPKKRSSSMFVCD